MFVLIVCCIFQLLLLLSHDNGNETTYYCYLVPLLPGISIRCSLSGSRLSGQPNIAVFVRPKLVIYCELKHFDSIFGFCAKNAFGIELSPHTQK